MTYQRTACIAAFVLALMAAAGSAGDKIYTIDSNGAFVSIDIDSLTKSALVVYVKMAPDGSGVVLGHGFKINKKGKVKPKGGPVVLSPNGSGAPADGDFTGHCVGVGNNGKDFRVFYGWGEVGAAENDVFAEDVGVKRGVPNPNDPDFVFNPPPFLTQHVDDVFRPVGSPIPEQRFPPQFRDPRGVVYGETFSPPTVQFAGSYEVLPDPNFFFKAIDSSTLGRSDAPRIIDGAYNAYPSPGNANVLWGDYMFIYDQGGDFDNPGIGGGIVVPNADPIHIDRIPLPNQTPVGITPFPSQDTNRAAVLLLQNTGPRQLTLEEIESALGNTQSDYSLTRQQTDSRNLGKNEMPTTADSSLWTDADLIRGSAPAADDSLIFFEVEYNRSKGKFVVHPFDSDGKFTGQSFTSKSVGKTVRALRAHVAGTRLLIAYTTGTETNQTLRVYAMDLPRKLR